MREGKLLCFYDIKRLSYNTIQFYFALEKQNISTKIFQYEC